MNEREMERILVTGEVYHIFGRSIAEYKIFNGEDDFLRIMEEMRFYQKEKQALSFSRFTRASEKREKFRENAQATYRNKKLVGIIAYCIMPTHIHLILKQQEGRKAYPS